MKGLMIFLHTDKNFFLFYRVLYKISQEQHLLCFHDISTTVFNIEENEHNI